VGKKKKRKLGPRCKRMKRPARLQSAKMWIPTYTGKNLVKGYCKHFAVDLVCAVNELRMLDAKLDEQYVARALQSREQAILARQDKKQEEKERANIPEDSDDNFYFIAGYTSWGFAYGLTWEEAEASGLACAECKRILCECSSLLDVSC
jgi:hypothetical protein